MINPDQVIAASLRDGKIVVDDNHSTDLAAPKGMPAPARGWIDSMESRADGIWGHVSWTAAGRQMVQSGEYRGISPVVSHTADGTIIAILRASLVNRPNFVGLTTLHAENAASGTGLDKLLAEWLGLDLQKYRQLIQGSPHFRQEIERCRQFFIEQCGSGAAGQSGTEAVALSASDHTVVSMMGLDPNAFRNTIAGEAREVSLHRATSNSAFAESEFAIVRAMGVDPAGYLKTRALEAIKQTRW